VLATVRVQHLQNGARSRTCRRDAVEIGVIRCVIAPTGQRRKAHMRQTIGNIALLVRDYDEAINYFTRVLRFTLVEDTRLGDAKR
jgi:hypothetical protein